MVWYAARPPVPEGFFEVHAFLERDDSGFGLVLEDCFDETGKIFVSGFIDGSPASRSKLQKGDVMWHANGQSLEGMAFVDVMTVLRDNPVRLTVLRAEDAGDAESGAKGKGAGKKRRSSLSKLANALGRSLGVSGESARDGEAGFRGESSSIAEQGFTMQCGSVRVHFLDDQNYEIFASETTTATDVCAQVADLLALPPDLATRCFALFVQSGTRLSVLEKNAKPLEVMSQWSAHQCKQGTRFVFKQWVYASAWEMALDKSKRSGAGDGDGGDDDDHDEVAQHARDATDTSWPSHWLTFIDARWHVLNGFYACSPAQAAVLGALAARADEAMRAEQLQHEGYSGDANHRPGGDDDAAAVPGDDGRSSLERVHLYMSRVSQAQETAPELAARFDGFFKQLRDAKMEALEAQQIFVENVRRFPTYGCTFFPAEQLVHGSSSGVLENIVVAIGSEGIHLVTGANLNVVQTYAYDRVAKWMMSSESNIFAFAVDGSTDLVTVQSIHAGEIERTLQLTVTEMLASEHQRMLKVMGLQDQVQAADTDSGAVDGVNAGAGAAKERVFSVTLEAVSLSPHTTALTQQVYAEAT